MKTLFYYEYLLLARNKSFWLLSTFLLLITLYSLQNGKAYYNQQSTIIFDLKNKEKATIQESIHALSADTSNEEGLRNYKSAATASWAIFSQKCYVYWQPSALSVWCIGNRDVYPYYQEILPISLYMRLFKTEITNPIILLIGSIDFSYILTFLWPLFLIALTFDIVSYDKESNLSPIIDMNVSNKIAHYGKRFSFYALVALLFIILLFLLAIVFLPSGYEHLTIAKIYFYGILYSFFWLICSFVITLTFKSSIQNVTVLISTWLFFIVMLPSVANQLSISLYPVHTEALSDNIRRVQLEESKDVFQQTLDTFYYKYPAYKKSDTAYSVLFSKAYLAEGKLNDLKGDSLLNMLIQQMQQKESFLHTIAYADPAMLLQNTMCNAAESNLRDYTEYLRSVQQYNDALKTFYFDRAFDTDIITIEDYKQRFPRYSSK